VNESRPSREITRPPADELFEGLELEVPQPTRALGCRLGFLRHLLVTRKRSAEELGARARSVPGLEAYLVEGVNRASAGRQPPVRRFEDILERWGVQRTEHAVALFERRLHRPPRRQAS